MTESQGGGEWESDRCGGWSRRGEAIGARGVRVSVGMKALFGLWRERVNSSFRYLLFIGLTLPD